MSDTVLIRLSNVLKTYCVAGVSACVLNKVSLTVNQGDLLAVLGASGSGKSTLMNIIGLLDKADSGTYYLNGRSVSDLSDDELAQWRNRHIGFVFQQFHLLPRLTALQNVALPLTYRSLSSKEIEQQAFLALGRVGMGSYVHHRPTQLSGGQQQRVAVARALVTQAQIILADEPTGALDSRTGAEVMNLFLALHAEGKTIIIVTHDEHIAAQCKKRITLVDGMVQGNCA